MRELTVEQFLCAQAAARGGLAIKHGVGGWPDRVVVLHGKHGWCEVKRRGQVARALQARRIADLRALGAFADVVDSHTEVMRFLDRLEALS
jgi:hypothetical protein